MTITSFLRSPSLVRSTGTMLLTLAAAAALTGCGKTEPEKAPAAQESPPAAPAAPAVAEAPPPAAATAPAAAAPAPAPKPDEGGPSDEEIAQRVATFKAFHPFFSGTQLSKTPQFAAQLSDVLDALAKDPALMPEVRKLAANRDKINEGGPGVRVDLKVTNLSLPFSNRLLPVVLSGRPRRLVDFVAAQSAENVSFILVPDPSMPSP